jgi:sigma-E factor negative regulatory protein RseC
VTPEISHQGCIVEIDDQKIKVQILSQSACSSCRAKGMCAAFEMTEKMIEVRNDHKYGYKTGEHVDLVMTQSMGNKAVILGYGLPFVLVLITLLIASQFIPELYAGLVSLAILAPYYLVLYYLKDRLSNSFDFKIKPLRSVIPNEES